MSRLAADSGLSVSLLERGMAGLPYLKRPLMPEEVAGDQVRGASPDWGSGERGIPGLGMR